MSDLSASATPSDWKAVPGEEAKVSKGFQIRQGMLGQSSTLPPAMQAVVFAAILPAGERVVECQHLPRVYVTGPEVDLQLGFGAPTNPCVAVTTSRLLLFYEFSTAGLSRGITLAPRGVDQVRQYLELPFAGASLSPLARRDFSLTWSSGLRLQMFSTKAGAPFSRGGPLRAIYSALSGSVQQPA